MSTDASQPDQKRKRGRPIGTRPLLGPKRRAWRPVLGLFPGVCRTALAAKIGVHRTHVTRILRGRAGCSGLVLEVLADELGVTKEDLAERLSAAAKPKLVFGSRK